MIQVRLKNPKIIITPVTQEEIDNGFTWGTLYVLYKNQSGEIEIGIPEMINHFPTTANMSGLENATEKAFFCNGGSKLVELSSKINDRPIYSICPTDDRKVEEYEVINGVDVNLGDVLNGTFKVSSQNKKRTI